MQQGDLLYQPGIDAHLHVAADQLEIRMQPAQMNHAAWLPAQLSSAFVLLCIFARGYCAGTAPRTSERSSPHTNHLQQYKHALAVTETQVSPRRRRPHQAANYAQGVFAWGPRQTSGRAVLP